MDDHLMSDRLAGLERRLRATQLAVVTALIVGGAAGVATGNAAQNEKAIRVRSLVVEDASGHDRIVLGAPLADPQGRISPSSGIRINDPQGVERFAVGLLDNNRVVMGFDAPPGTGDPRNRERITIVADDTGGAYIRFLNRKTGVPGRLLLDTDDHLYLEFNDVIDGKFTVKRIGFTGERVVSPQ